MTTAIEKVKNICGTGTLKNSHLKHLCSLLLSICQQNT